MNARPLQRASPLNDTPPRIFTSAAPGEPVCLRRFAGAGAGQRHDLSVAVNTNWNVFFDSDSKSWYLLARGRLAGRTRFKRSVGSGRQAAARVREPCRRTQTSPTSAQQIPGRVLAAKDAPTVYVSTTPAEIIIIDGPPKFAAIAGTTLEYLANSPVAVFRDKGTKTIYYLVSGRWFSAPGFDGPWTFATHTLPPDFRRIPPDSPRGSVLASVPGTVQAQEALIHAQIPQQATLKREAATVNVVYAGAPKFEAIPGTTMYYAVNTSYDVVRVGESYYACYQGAWFVAPAPTGAWTLAPLVPEVIYTIPPASPLYRCTYVRVYGVTPTTVTYGYTAGYTMAYVSSGVVVYGTGYYYPPYIYPAADTDLLPVSGVVRRCHVLQLGDRCLGARWRRLWTVLWCARRHRLQPDDRRVGSGRCGLRSIRRGRCILGVQPDDGQLCAWQRGLRIRGCHRQR